MRHTNLDNEIEIHETPKESKLVWAGFILLAVAWIAVFALGYLKTLV